MERSNAFYPRETEGVYNPLFSALVLLDTKTQSVNLLTYLLCTRVTMRVCMAGSARTNVFRVRTVKCIDSLKRC